MEIISKMNDIYLVKKFDKYFIRFFIGSFSEIPVEYEIPEEKAKTIIASPNVLEEVHNILVSDVDITTAMGLAVLNYANNVHPNISEDDLANKISIISKYKDIYDEFYDAIIYLQLFSDKCVTVEDYSAFKLVNDFKYNLIDAYVYLVYLREHPEEALKNLKPIS